MPYVRSITDVLTDHLGWNRARLKLIARFKAAMLKLQTANLWKIAVALKAGVQIRSNYRRIQRFLAGYDVDFAELGRLLVKLLPESEPHVVVIDRTEWHFGSTPVNILAVGIAHRGVAFPVAWKVLPKGGSSEASEQIDVLERFLGIVDPSSVEVVIADREFISIEWLCRLQERDIPFVIRLRSRESEIPTAKLAWLQTARFCQLECLRGGLPRRPRGSWKDPVFFPEPTGSRLRYVWSLAGLVPPTMRTRF